MKHTRVKKGTGSLSDIQEKMSANHATNSALRDENLDLQGKLKGLIDQYEKAQTTVDKVLQRNAEMTKELEKHQKEKELLMLELQQSYKRAELMQEQEKALRSQVDTYTEKYNEFQTSLQNSNQVFQTFKSEMDKMTKKIKKLEKESVQWKQRADSANKTLLTMAEEKAKSDKEKTTLMMKCKRLEDLCRALQAKMHGAASGGEIEKDNLNLEEENQMTSSVTLEEAELGSNDDEIVDKQCGGETPDKIVEDTPENTEEEKNDTANGQLLDGASDENHSDPTVPVDPADEGASSSSSSSSISTVKPGISLADV